VAVAVVVAVAAVAVVVVVAVTVSSSSRRRSGSSSSGAVLAVAVSSSNSGSSCSCGSGSKYTHAHTHTNTHTIIRFNLNKGKFMKFGLRVFADPDASRANSLQIDIRINEGGAATLQGHPINIYESDEAMELRVLVDRSLAESFVQGGRHAFTNPFCALEPQDMDRMGVEAYNDGVAGVDFDITIHQMQTANVMPTH